MKLAVEAMVWRLMSVTVPSALTWYLRFCDGLTLKSMAVLPFGFRVALALQPQRRARGIVWKAPGPETAPDGGVLEVEVPWGSRACVPGAARTCYVQVDKHATGRPMGALGNLSTYPQWDKDSESARRMLHCLRCYVLSFGKVGVDAAAWLALAVHGTSPLKAAPPHLVRSEVFGHSDGGDRGGGALLRRARGCGGGHTGAPAVAPAHRRDCAGGAAGDGPGQRRHPEADEGAVGGAQEGPPGRETVWALPAAERCFHMYEAATPAWCTVAHGACGMSLTVFQGGPEGLSLYPSF